VHGSARGLKQSASVKSITVLLSLDARAERAARRFRANIFSICATGMRKRINGPSYVGGAAQGSDDALSSFRTIPSAITPKGYSPKLRCRFSNQWAPCLAVDTAYISLIES